jgi:hypothetical protein
LSSNIEAVIGFGSVVLFAILVLFFSSRKIRTNFPPIFRKITTINKVKRAIGLAVEDGSRLHVSLGSANLIDPSITSAFVGLSALNRIGQLTSTSDLPPITTGGSGGLFLLSQGVLKTISVETNTQAFYNPNYAKITGVTPFSYALGTMESIQDQGKMEMYTLEISVPKPLFFATKETKRKRLLYVEVIRSPRNLFFTP